MKKTVSLLIVVLMTIILIKPFTAKADVIWEPYGDKFYEKHASEMQRENHTYIVNSPEGYVYTYENPDKVKKNIGFKKNGEGVPCAYSIDYEGHKWGLINYEKSEWMILDDCYRDYDSELFERDHKNELVAEEKQVELKESFFYFQYPGSGEGAQLFDCPDAYSELKYVDEDGNEWLYFGYTYGLRDFWVNITDPENKNCKKLEIKYDFEIYAPKDPSTIPTDEPQNEKTEEDLVQDEDSSNGDVATKKGALVGIGVALAVAVIGAAIAIILKIKKK